MRLLALLVLPALLLATSAVALAQQVTTVTVRESPQLGRYLADSRGMTLYIFRNDKPNESNCYDRCAQLWPILEATGQLTLPPGTPGKLDAIQRRDGKRQVTYNGWPLYYWAQDQAPGETKGHLVGNNWYVAVPGETAQVLPPPPAPAAAAAAPAPAAPAQLPRAGGPALPLDAAALAGLVLLGAGFALRHR